MNGSLIHESSGVLAKAMLEATSGASAGERISWMILHILGRAATEAELARGEGFIADYSSSADQADGWSAFARVLFSTNEFLYIE